MPRNRTAGRHMPLASQPDWIGKEFAALRAEIAELRAARTLESAFIGAGGITIGDAGSLIVKDADGHLVAVIGALPPEFNRADGSPQLGIVIYREDGTLAAALADFDATTPPFKQAWQILDRAGNTILSDDTNSGKGLASPHLSLGTVTDTNVARWPATTAATWTSIAEGFVERQNPRVLWDFLLFAPASVTGQFRLLLDGVQIGTTQTVVGGGAGTFASWIDTRSFPSSLDMYATGLLELQGQVTAGAGTIAAQQLFLAGAQS